MSTTHMIIVLSLATGMFTTLFSTIILFMVLRQLRVQREQFTFDFGRLLYKYAPPAPTETQTARVVRLKEFAETEQFLITVNLPEKTYQEAS